jgi:hypothetical protein
VIALLSLVSGWVSYVEVHASMAVSQPVSDSASLVVDVDLDARRAQLRRRRRWHALREWAGFAAVALACTWLAALALITVLGR